MREFIVTSDKFTGHIVYKFNAAGNVTCIDMQQADVDDTQRRWLLEHIPEHVPSLESMVKKTKTLKMQEMAPDLSFEAFWNKYDYKVGDKKKCKAIWEKMADEYKAIALNSIPMYNKWIQQKNYDKIYPERFLSKAIYLNEFKA